MLHSTVLNARYQVNIAALFLKKRLNLPTFLVARAPLGGARRALRACAQWLLKRAGMHARDRDVRADATAAHAPRRDYFFAQTLFRNSPSNGSPWQVSQPCSLPSTRFTLSTSSACIHAESTFLSLWSSVSIRPWWHESQ